MPIVPPAGSAGYALRGNPIAARVIAKMKRGVRGKARNLRLVISGRAVPEDLEDAVVTKEALADYHPAHAAYVYAQNQVSVMSEQLSELAEMAPFVDIVAKTEELYMPSSPPLSPLTTSYYTCWAFFDACAGPADETIGSTILAAGAVFGMDPELLRVVRLMQESRMGLYTHEGTEGSLAVLKDLVTGTVRRAIVPAGYLGQRGELWFVRVFPPPIPGGAEHVVFTTPYIILRPAVREWLAYFSRTFPESRPASVEDYERHMKYGPTRTYWNEFIFEAYVNYRMEAIFLAGLPDVPESLPHSAVNDRGFGQ